MDLCIGAGDCIEVCPVDIFDFVNNKVDADNIGECTDCMACQGVCPNDAILKHSAWS